MPLMLTAADGHCLDAHFAAPQGKARGGLVVVQEAFGVTAYVKRVCEFFAGEGYAALAPALYDRQQRHAVFESHDDLAHARKLRAGLVWPDVVKDMAAGVERLREHGPVGVVGYCVGGSVAFVAALELDIAAAVSYYGRDVVEWLERKPRCPVMFHFGERDHLIPMADVEKVRHVYPKETYVYPAGHGFDREDSESSRLARRRTLDFFERHLGSRAA